MLMSKLIRRSSQILKFNFTIVCVGTLTNASMCFFSVRLSFPSAPQTPSSQMAPSHSSLSVGSSSGVTTPGGHRRRGRTVKEYEDNMREIKKENFNLKLRIYFLEERLGATNKGTETNTEQVSRLNTDLKVSIVIKKV